MHIIVALSESLAGFLNWWCCRSGKRLLTFMFFNAHFVSEKKLLFFNHTSIYQWEWDLKSPSTYFNRHHDDSHQARGVKISRPWATLEQQDCSADRKVRWVPRSWEHASRKNTELEAKVLARAYQEDALVKKKKKSKKISEHKERKILDSTEVEDLVSATAVNDDAINNDQKSVDRSEESVILEDLSSSP